jgi:hypothetical protein
MLLRVRARALEGDQKVIQRPRGCHHLRGDLQLGGVHPEFRLPRDKRSGTSLADSTSTRLSSLVRFSTRCVHAVPAGAQASEMPQIPVQTINGQNKLQLWRDAWRDRSSLQSRTLCRIDIIDLTRVPPVFTHIALGFLRLEFRRHDILRKRCVWLRVTIVAGGLVLLESKFEGAQRLEPRISSYG